MNNPYEMTDEEMYGRTPLEPAQEEVSDLVEAWMTNPDKDMLELFESEINDLDITQMMFALTPDERGHFDDCEIGRIYRRRTERLCREHVERMLKNGKRHDQVFEGWV